jgi:hypothetical protein
VKVAFGSLLDRVVVAQTDQTWNAERHAVFDKIGLPPVSFHVSHFGRQALFLVGM